MGEPLMLKWALNGGANPILGALLAGLIFLFAFLNGIPWASKSEVLAFKSDVQREFADMKDDVKEIRRMLTILLRDRGR